MKEYPPHELCSLFPPMGDGDYSTLVESIREVGLKDDIVLLDKEVLDGAHRQSACLKAKVKPRYRQFNPNIDGPDPISFVIQKNLARRNLTPSKAATIGAELVEKFKEQEKAEKAAAKAANLQPKSKRPKGSKTKKAAKALNVSERSVAEAAALKKSDPEEFAKVKKGEQTLHAGTTKAKAKKSVADRKSEEFAKATAIIDKVCGDGFCKSIEDKLSSNDVVKLSELDKDEIKRVKPFIEGGWKLKAALGYKSVSLTYAHNIRQLCDRALAQGGTYILEIGEWEIVVKKKE